MSLIHQYLVFRHQRVQASCHGTPSSAQFPKEDLTSYLRGYKEFLSNLGSVLGAWPQGGRLLLGVRCASQSKERTKREKKQILRTRNNELIEDVRFFNVKHSKNHC